MINLAEDLINRGNTPLLIATDSIAWLGDSTAVDVSNTKVLGGFSWEAKSCNMVVASPKAYQMQFEDGSTITRWAGVDKTTTSSMAFGDILGGASQLMAYNDTTKLFVPIDEQWA